MESLHRYSWSAHIASASFRKVCSFFAVMLLVLATGCNNPTNQAEVSSQSEMDSSSVAIATSQPSKEDLQRIWANRAIEELDRIDDADSRANAALNTCLPLAPMGEYSTAKQLIQKYVPEDRRDQALIRIADAQSINGDFDQALETIASLSDVQQQQWGWTLVASRQAQRGEVDNALGLLDRIENQNCLDRLNRWIVEAQARAGDITAAKQTTEKIVGEKQFREAQQVIALAEANDLPPSLMEWQPNFATTYVKALLLFSEESPCRDAAMNALAAAEQKNTMEMDDWISRTLIAAENEEELTQATAYLLLTVALMDAQRYDEASAMTDRFLSAANEEVVGMSGLYGRQVLAYLFTANGMEEELQKVLAPKPKQEDSLNVGSTSNSDLMMGVGAGEVTAEDWPGLELRYENLSDPADRVNLSCGALMGLDNYEANKPSETQESTTSP